MPDILRHVRRAVLASLLLLAGSFFADRASAEDSYLLALAWQPGFCADQAHADFSECKIAPKDQPRLVLHGLWPDWDANGDGKRNAADDFCIPGDDNRNSMMALDKGNWLKLPPMKLSQARSNDLAAAMPGTTMNARSTPSASDCPTISTEAGFRATGLIRRARWVGSPSAAAVSAW